MPDQAMWESFFCPSATLQKMGLNRYRHKVVDFGCGYGTFSIPVAQITKGVVYAVDIDDGFISVCERKAKEAGLHTVICEQRDFILNGVSLADDTVDYAMLFNILHAENPVSILQEAYRVLLPFGKAGVIHWNYDRTTPRRSSMNIRPCQNSARRGLSKAGFESIQPYINLPPYHYGIVGQKPRLDLEKSGGG